MQNETKIVERFKKYVSINTISDHNSLTYPSTDTQLVFAKMLVEECKQIGLTDVNVDKYCYVTATLNSNINHHVKTVGFVSHMDTSPDFCGENVKPQIVKNYDGNDIKLLSGQVINTSDFPVLKKYVGQDIITTDGFTLLGADDKAGVCEIISAMEYLINNPQIPHGKIVIAFTPDEEVGNGVKYFDVEKFGADFAYTMDGGEIGELEFESFNAARAKINISGKSVHPGHAKDTMINAANIANEIANKFPSNETPQTTSDYEGFYHLTEMSGSVTEAKLTYIIRDFYKDKFEERKAFVEKLVSDANAKLGNELVELTIYDEYYNMGEILSQSENKNIMEIAKKAIENIGVEIITKPIRGGTDGSRLSFMGLPCPNIFAGGHNFHGPFEFLPINSMIKATEVIVEICKLVATDHKD